MSGSSRIKALLLVSMIASAIAGSIGCYTGPIVECTGSASHPCYDGSCAISPDACPTDPGCPITHPARCSKSYCSQDYVQCPPYGSEGQSAEGVIFAPEPTATPAPIN